MTQSNRTSEIYNESIMFSNSPKSNNYRNMNKTSDELLETFYRSGQIKHLVCNENDNLDGISFTDDLDALDDEIYLKNKYWMILKNHLQVAYMMSKKILKKSYKRQVLKQKSIKTEVTRIAPTTQQIAQMLLPENEWFYKKYEREVGEPFSRGGVDMKKVEKSLRCRAFFKKCEIETCLYKEFHEQPRYYNIADVTWGGPIMKYCGCFTYDCDCKGNMVLPPQHIPIAGRYTWTPRFYLQMLTCFMLFKPKEPEKNFTERLLQNVKAEQDAYKKLQQKGFLKKRGPEFCLYRCLHYSLPEARRDTPFLELKRQLKEAYLNKKPPPVLEMEVVEEEEEEFLVDGYYRTIATQATTNDKGEFIMGEVSHILFGRLGRNVLCDLEGKGLNVFSYTELPKTKEQEEEPETVKMKINKLLSVQRLKRRLSKLTNNVFSSIVEIEDPGIPINTRGTQDPPLNDFYESIIELPKPGVSNFELDDLGEICPCCDLYKKSLALKSNVNSEKIMYDRSNVPKDLNIQSDIEKQKYGQDAKSIAILPTGSDELKNDSKAENEVILKGHGNKNEGQYVGDNTSPQSMNNDKQKTESGNKSQDKGLIVTDQDSNNTKNEIHQNSNPFSHDTKLVTNNKITNNENRITTQDNKPQECTTKPTDFAEAENINHTHLFNKNIKYSNESTPKIIEKNNIVTKNEIHEMSKIVSSEKNQIVINDRTANDNHKILSTGNNNIKLKIEDHMENLLIKNTLHSLPSVSKNDLNEESSKTIKELNADKNTAENIPHRKGNSKTALSKETTKYSSEKELGNICEDKRLLWSRNIKSCCSDNIMTSFESQNTLKTVKTDDIAIEKLEALSPENHDIKNISRNNVDLVRDLRDDLNNNKNEVSALKIENVGTTEPYVGDELVPKNASSHKSANDTSDFVDSKNPVTDVFSKVQFKNALSLDEATKEIEKTSLNTNRKVLSLNNIKLHVKQSFKKVSSNISDFIKNLHKQSQKSITKISVRKLKEASGVKDKVISKIENQNSKKSEKEVFSLQYTSDLTADSVNNATIEVDVASGSGVFQFINVDNTETKTPTLKKETDA